MTWLPYAYWLLAVLLMAAGQGLLLPAIRRTAPGPEARRQAFALHYVLLASYFLPVLLATSTWAVAVLARLLLFDPVLNLAAGTSVFSVGQTAASDRALRWLATKLGMVAEHLRFLLWLVSIVAAVATVVLQHY